MAKWSFRYLERNHVLLLSLQPCLFDGNARGLFANDNGVTSRAFPELYTPHTRLYKTMYTSTVYSDVNKCPNTRLDH